MRNVPHAATAVRRFEMTETALKRTPLYDEHARLGAKLVPFAGYDMPVQYPSGIMAEHKWTREHAGLFDVSHMGQCLVVGRDFESVARAMETLVPADIAGLQPQQQRYSQLLNDAGGTIDDLMISRTATNGQLYVVVNAGRKDVDYAHIEQHLPPGVKLVRLDDKALVALQGPQADAILSAINPAVQEIPFMAFARVELAGIDAQVSRSGYSGEDGFEISVAANDAGKLWTLLLNDDRARPVGLGARDSLRLEAGLCLYGHELDEAISPIEAGLLWSIGKRRRSEGGFIGANRVLQEITNGTSRKRVGIRPDGKAPARDGTIVQDMNGRDIGKVTSGGFGPSVNGPIAMGYVEASSSVPGTSVQLIVRGQAMPATIVKLPFVPNNFKR
jgi:aminomethyltransferase